jgi:hypothetical protein
MHRRRMGTKPLPLVGALLLASGCFRYEPLGDLRPSTGEMVRVHLTNSGSATLGSVLGPEARVVDGVMRNVPDSAYVVAVSAVTRDGARVEWAGETVSLHRDAVAFIEHRTFDAHRSAIAVGTSVVVALLAARFARNAGGGTAGPDGGGNPAP